MELSIMQGCRCGVMLEGECCCLVQDLILVNFPREAVGAETRESAGGDPPRTTGMAGVEGGEEGSESLGAFVAEE